jgi:hypothetical protein
VLFVLRPVHKITNKVNRHLNKSTFEERQGGEGEGRGESRLTKSDERKYESEREVRGSETEGETVVRRRGEGRPKKKCLPIAC